MPLDKKTYEFQIAGVPYKLKTSHDPSTVEELVRYVDEKINSAISATKSGSFQNASILAALNIAEELLLLKRKAVKQLDLLESKAQRLASDLESSAVPKQS